MIQMILNLLEILKIKYLILKTKIIMKKNSLFNQLGIVIKDINWQLNLRKEILIGL